MAGFENLLVRIYYLQKPLIPRIVQINLRRQIIRWKRAKYRQVWPILKLADEPPKNWHGWPDGKKFSLVLTHDVESREGHKKCIKLMELEKKLGFRSSFNFVPEGYRVSPELRKTLLTNGFGIGVHGLKHDGKLYYSQKIFRSRVRKINRYLSQWDAVGFRSPAMHHNLDWIGELNIEYDMSTFDTDPFEPQADGVNTIFPFWKKIGNNGSGFVEIPYTLAQDFTLFILMRKKNTGIWQRKLDWIAEKGGMALLNTHPDYMAFNNKAGLEKYPVRLYKEFLETIKEKYYGQYWHALPKEISEFWRKRPVGKRTKKEEKNRRKVHLHETEN